MKIGIYFIRLKRLFQSLNPLNESITIPAHREVLRSIKDLSRLIPSKYNHYDIPYIIEPKAYGYYTSLDSKYLRFSQYASLLNKVIRNKQLSHNISYRILAQRINKYKKVMVKQDIGDPGTFNGQSFINYRKQISYNTFYNLLFTNAASYLRVLILYIKQSQFDNNILVIPYSLKELEILKEIDPQKILYFNDFVSEDIKSFFTECSQEFAEIFYKNQKSLESIFTLNGYHFYPFIKAGIEKIFRFTIPQSILVYQIIEEISKEININCVIGARVRKIFDRAFYKFANNNNIPRYVLLHADIGSDIKFMDSMGHFNDLYGVFVWGPSQKKMIECDIFSNVQKIYTTGSPLFEVENRTTDTSAIKKHKILYACGMNDKYEIRMMLKTLSKILNNYYLIVKVHPGVNNLKYYDRFRNENNVEVLGGKTVIEDLLNDCDLFVTTTSSSSYQAMIKNIPTLFMNLNNKWTELILPYYKFDNLEEKRFVVNNRKELEQFLYKLFTLNNFRSKHIEFQKSFINRYIKIHNSLNGASHEIDTIISS